MLRVPVVEGVCVWLGDRLGLRVPVRDADCDGDGDCEAVGDPLGVGVPLRVCVGEIDGVCDCVLA